MKRLLLTLVLLGSPAQAAEYPPAIRAALADVGRRFGPVELVSTCRPGAVIAGTHHASLHAACRAVDFNPARGTYTRVAAYLRRTWKGGVGTYACAMHHIHIDDGPAYRWHHCVNSSGLPIKGKRRAHRRRA